MKIKNVIKTFVFALFIGIFAAFCMLKPADLVSESERRPLAQMPEVNAESVFSGQFMTDFDEYSTDQFPMRDFFRGVKAWLVTEVLNKKDNNKLFYADGHLSTLEYPIKDEMIEHAAGRFDYIYENYLEGKDMNIYLSVVPDKNYYIAEKNGYLAIDYDEFMKKVTDRLGYMEYIDITSLLDKNDYYKTDSHWKMEEIVPVAEFIAEKMGADVKAEYDVNVLENPFYGVYAGQSALKASPDEIKYLTNDTLSGCTVLYYDTGKGVAGELYDMEKATGKDPYEMFLSGSTPLCVIENENADTDKELIIFRDSFGSSIAPLFIEGYKKVTVIDIRYVKSEFLGSFVNFEKGDVLFLYSTTLLNNSLALR